MPATMRYCKGLFCVFISCIVGACSSLDNYKVGLRYYEAEDYARAMPYLERAAALENPDAKNKLGMLYRGAKSIPQDPTKALSLIRESAEAGDSGGQNNLGMAYRVGDLVSQNNRLAIYWLEKAAAQDNTIAMRNLSSIYSSDVRDHDRRYQWVKKGSSLGDVYLTYELAVMYLDGGQGVGRNYTEGIRYLKAAADNFQNPDSAYPISRLGDMYLHGKLQKHDMVRVRELLAKWGAENKVAATYIDMIESADGECQPPINQGQSNN